MLGEKLSRIDQDVEQISQYGADIGNTVFKTLSSSWVNLAIMMSLDWRMTVQYCLCSRCFSGSPSLRGSIQSKADHAAVKGWARDRRPCRHLSAVPQIQILGLKRCEMSRTVRAWLELVNAQWEAAQDGDRLSSSLSQAFLALGIFLVLGLGAHELL